MSKQETKLKRYDFYNPGSIPLVQSDNGQYVLFSDVEHLIEALKFYHKYSDCTESCQTRGGGWMLRCKCGFDEGHKKFHPITRTFLTNMKSDSKIGMGE